MRFARTLCHASPMHRPAMAAALAIATAAATVGTIFGAASATAAPSGASAGATLAAASTPSAAPTPDQCLARNGVRCLTPATLATVYGIDGLRAKGLTGKGVSIGIVDSFGSPTIRQDLDVFDKQYGLPAVNLQVVTPAGAPPAFNARDSDMAGWATETTLDVEVAHAVAPDAQIVLIETPTSETEGLAGFPDIIKAEQAMISSNKVDIISQSFAATEETFDSRAQIQQLSNEIYPQVKQAGVTVLSSSGDDGPTDVMLDMKTLYTYPVTSWPASDPLVTSVGGTRLDVTAGGQRATADRAWGGPGVNGAGGGGRSTVFPQPAFQSTISGATGGRRAVPDVAFDADPASGLTFYGSFDGGGWSIGGGTSQAAPLFAGIVALADQAAGKRIGFLNDALYRLASAADHGASSGIVDVTSGSNNLTGRTEVPGYSATAGYDLATGLGTVNAALFVPAIVSATAAQAQPLASAAVPTSASSSPPTAASSAPPASKSSAPASVRPTAGVSAEDAKGDTISAGTIAVAVIVFLVAAGGTATVVIQRRRGRG
jgi:subtilase family serine protease